MTTPSPDGSPGVDQLVEVGDDMAELLREVIAQPIVPIQKAAEAVVLVERWRKVRPKEKGNVPD